MYKRKISTRGTIEGQLTPAQPHCIYPDLHKNKKNRPSLPLAHHDTVVSLRSDLKSIPRRSEKTGFWKEDLERKKNIMIYNNML